MMLLDRRREMGKKELLPSGYTQVVGIYARNNNCYINTGMYIDQDCDIYIKCKGMAHTYGLRLLGSWPVIQAKWNFNYSSKHDDFFLSGNFVAQTRCYYNTVHEIRISRNGLDIDGNITPVTVTDGVSTQPLLIGATNNRYGTATSYSGITFYDIVVNGERFVPCKRNSDDKYGLFNIATQEFLSSANASSEFIEGT